MKATLLALAASVATVSPFGAGAQDPAPVPAHAISLGDRTFMGTSTTYDANFGLYKIGVVQNHVLKWLAPEHTLPTFPKPQLIYRNFEVYNYHSEAGWKGNVSVPVIGLAGSASEDKSVYANLQDINEVTAPDPQFSTCKLWSFVPNNQVTEPTA